jgi:putative sigma-54 modulation protein
MLGRTKMQLEIRRKGVRLDQLVREQIADQIDVACAKFAGRIRRIMILLLDTNGPRGGPDKRCQIAVQLSQGATVRSECTDTNFTAAIHLATDRVTHTVSRVLERRKQSVRRTRKLLTTDGE